MKKTLLALALLLVLSVLCFSLFSPEDTVPPETQPETTAAPTTAPTIPTTLLPETEATLPPIVLELTEDEQTMLLKIGMAELGSGDCAECIALVMCTILNRVEADGFGSSIYSVLHAPEQFTPVSDGTYAAAEPNDLCYEALDMVLRGWDESQGALYYEFCEEESWHSKNLKLLFQHCITRFYK